MEARLDKTASRFAKAEADLAVTEDAIAQASARLATAQSELLKAQSSISHRAEFAYRMGPIGLFEILSSAKGLGDFLRRKELLERISRADASTVVRATRARNEIKEVQEELRRRKAHQAAVLSELKKLSLSLSKDLERARRLQAQLLADASERARIEEERRRRQTLAAQRSRLASGRFVCPVDDPNTVTDSFGDPRSGGRRHQGIDIMAAKGTPTAAVVNGTILRMNSSTLGGISLYLKGTDGTEYYYTHLNGYADIRPGQQVTAGEHIAYVGTTGNASESGPHLHFEIHPGGGSAVNPYPTVKAACG